VEREGDETIDGREGGEWCDAAGVCGWPALRSIHLIDKLSHVVHMLHAFPREVWGSAVDTPEGIVANFTPTRSIRLLDHHHFHEAVWADYID